MDRDTYRLLAAAKNLLKLADTVRATITAIEAAEGKPAKKAGRRPKVLDAGGTAQETKAAKPAPIAPKKAPRPTAVKTPAKKATAKAPAEPKDGKKAAAPTTAPAKKTPAPKAPEVKKPEPAKAAVKKAVAKVPTTVVKKPAAKKPEPKTLKRKLGAIPKVASPKKTDRAAALKAAESDPALN
jgi:hypothetical protein